MQLPRRLAKFLFPESIIAVVEPEWSHEPVMAAVGREPRYPVDS
jgi:hypothetical protein